MVDLNVLLPHYLVRRARIASQPEFTAIEEMDWFMHFVDEALYFADDLDALGAVGLGSFTQPMDDYYEYIAGPRQKPATKPQVRMRAKYRTLIRQLRGGRSAGMGKRRASPRQLRTGGARRCLARTASGHGEGHSSRPGAEHPGRSRCRDPVRNSNPARSIAFSHAGLCESENGARWHRSGNRDRNEPALPNIDTAVCVCRYGAGRCASRRRS